MNHTNISNLVFNKLSNVELIDFINQFTPIKNESTSTQIEEEFRRRDFNYQHLINHKKELQLVQPLRLIDGNLFEVNIPKPPMVGNFYRKVKELIDFLKFSPFLEGKNLVTFDYILDQFYATKDDVKIIEENELENLPSNTVFIGFKNTFQTFPNEQILDKISYLETFVIIDKGPFYRGLKEVVIYKNNQVVDVWKPTNIDSE
ncbi:MAG: hypothetical protein KIG88_13285 [Weeksellaceae bacterium]|nr:hypothetical protein [Weeksellaceae bacterium]